MKVDETLSVLCKLKNAYPLFYSNAKDNFDGVIGVWHEHIGKYNFDIAKKAVNKLIALESTVPTIAALIKRIDEVIEQESIKKQQASEWQKLGFESEEEYKTNLVKLRR